MSSLVRAVERSLEKDPKYKAGYARGVRQAKAEAEAQSALMIAAVVRAAGGSVRVPRRSQEELRDWDLVRMTDPATGDVVLTVRKSL